ncbi:hypothetical protein DJ568_10815 [Mucilaginibacter hurinus]|uniref:histidine kinase n=1 Tax=Mucilaginibacter hurinus TaxID=2201324 RepID=A0A367GNA7_9SPHI|nr:sensor histidine kinase [Mucilaginibacter hurinus]RCH54957.1 hypothetical protein DJ568_10815 [Mucilaginibacter hurinus]
MDYYRLTPSVFNGKRILDTFYSKTKYWLIAAFSILVIVSTNCTSTYAQKYNFTHYDIEDGLIQSQVNTLSEDSENRLWIGTLGGVCRFDGSGYFTFSKASGLPNNFVYSVFNDAAGNLWVGTHSGLSRYKNGKVYNYPVPPEFKSAWVTQIVQDGKGAIWLLMDRRLFRIHGKKMIHVNITGKDESVNALTVTRQGVLHAAVYKAGVYTLQDKKWAAYLPATGVYNDIQITRMLFDRKDSRTLYLLTPKGVLVAKAGLLRQMVPSPGLGGEKKNLLFNAYCLSLEQDADNNIWVGTDKGAYYFKNGTYTHFTAENGLSDNPVTYIYKDKSDNLWLATSGSGIFKYEGDAYVTYNDINAINNPVIMGIARGKNNGIVLGTDIGLLKYSANEFKPVVKPGLERVQNLFRDSKGNVWVGSRGAWRYDGETAELIKGTERHTVLNFAEDSNGVIWMATSMGCLYYKNNVIKALENNHIFISSLLHLGNDSVLVGMQEGVTLIVNKQFVKDFKLPAVSNSSIFSMIKSRNAIIIGTDDKGLFVWDRKKNIVKNYTDRNGLKSNAVYSLAVDDNDVIWAGTGRGVNRLAINYQTMDCKVLSNQYANDLVYESNQNAILYHNNKVYIGTAKGLSVYNTKTVAAKETAPYILIKQVNLFKNGKGEKGVLTPATTGLKLNADQNHLSISFLGVYLRDPSKVSYQYRLTGLEEKFSQPVKTNAVDYPALPPGKYTFEVRAVSPEGVLSANTARFSFEIVPPFYRTTWFTILAVALVILLIIGLQNLWHHNKKQRERTIEAIKHEEKLKIRQQTAEDFHDDLGNKLTRITVLSEMLDVQIAKDKPEQQKLVEQIRQNAISLYNGTKDILWALDPKSDNLYETLKYIEELGIEQFRDIGINFKCEGVDDEFKHVKLTMEYNRNITMIFKELMNNVLKHADARLVTLKASRRNKSEMVISLSDDGKGFDCKQASKGHGLKNIKTRAARINGELMVYSIINGGTNISLHFSINTNTLS